jgi:hypothetical protein
LTNVIGVIDGTLILIIAPKDNEADFVCRKGFHATNVQADMDVVTSSTAQQTLDFEIP